MKGSPSEQMQPIIYHPGIMALAAHRPHKRPFNHHFPGGNMRTLCRRSPAAALAAGVSMYHRLLLWHLRVAALLQHAGGPGDQRDLPHLRVHHPLLVHAAPAGRPHQQGRVRAVLGRGAALDRLQLPRLWRLGPCAHRQPGRRRAVRAKAAASVYRGAEL